MSWLQRSLNVAARFLALLSFKGFRHSARLGWISPSGWSLLPGAPALTRTDLSSARTTRLSGRTMDILYECNGENSCSDGVSRHCMEFLNLRAPDRLPAAGGQNIIGSQCLDR